MVRQQRGHPDPIACCHRGRNPRLASSHPLLGLPQGLQVYRCSPRKRGVPIVSLNGQTATTVTVADNYRSAPAATALSICHFSPVGLVVS